MGNRYVLWLCLSCLVYDFVSCQSVSPTENYPQSAQLDDDGKMILYWETNGTHIIFEVRNVTVQ